MTDDRRVPDDPRADAGLWDLVASVPVPPPGGEFMPRLAARLAAEPGVSAEVGGSGAVARPGTSVRAGRRLPTRLLIAAATVAVAAVIAFAVMPALRGAETATAADMLAAMTAAGRTQTVHLRLVETERLSASSGEGASKSRRRMTEDLILSVTGDYRGRGWLSVDEGPSAPIVSDFGYDAARHELRVASRSQGGGLEVLHPAWPTDLPYLTNDYLGYKAAASSVRALIAELDPDTPVDDTTYLDRPAWRATLSSAWQGSPGVIVTVDKATGLLLETRHSGPAFTGTTFLKVLRVTRFETDPALDAGWQVVPLLKKPKGGRDWNYVVDDGMRFGSPEAVAARAWPTLPVIPEWVPPGYSRTDMANAVYWDPRAEHAEDNSWHWSVGRVRPPGRLAGLEITKRLALKRCAQGVLVLFRRGFQSFTVEISPRLPGDPGLGDLEPEGRVSAEDTVLTGGDLKGARARTWICSAMLPVTHLTPDSMEVSLQGPTLLTYSDRSQVVIYGDLTRQELIDVANSLKIYGDVDRPLPSGYGD